MVILHLLAKCWNWLASIWETVEEKAKSHPVKTLTITVINEPMACYWFSGSNNTNIVVQGRFLVTNITDKPIRLSRPVLGKKIQSKGTATIRLLDSPSSSKRATIPPNAIVEVTITIETNVPLAKDDILTEDIAIVDNYGNPHWIKKVHFEGR